MEQNNGNKKSKKIVLVLIIFLLIILVATYVAYSYYVKNMANESLKNELVANIKNNDLSFFLENELYQNLSKRIKKDDFESNSDITLSTTMKNNMFSDLDLSKFQFHYLLTKDNILNKSYHKLQTQYAGNDFITFDFFKTQKKFAMKSDEIVNKYVGINDSNTQSMTNKIYKEEVDLTYLKKAKNFIIDREQIDLENIQNSQALKTCMNLVKKEILPSNISKKENVVITMDSNQITTTEYTVSLSNEQVSHIFDGIIKNIQDDEIISELVVSNVKDFENEPNTILEYKDNDNTIKIQGKENKFNTSIPTWDEETRNEVQYLNTVPANTTIEINNTTNNQNTVNTEVPSVDISTIPESNTNQDSTQITEESTEQQQQILENENNINQEQNLEEQIQEEDNFRMQGFIQVNEDTEEFSEDDEPFIIGKNYEDTAKNITNLIEKIDWFSYLKTGAKVNCAQEELKENIENILQNRIKQNQTLIIKVYVSEGKTIKIHFEIPETMESFDIEIVSKSDNEKYLNITFLKGKENNSNGNVVSIYCKKADTVTRTKFNINKITKSKISQKTSISIETKGTINAKKYTNDIQISYSDSEGDFKTFIQNSLVFDGISELEDLNEENCLFLDSLSEEDLLLTVDAIKQKTIDVLKEKNRNLNIIDINNSNLIVQQTEQNSNIQENNEVKEQAKQILIQTISNKMREYLNQEKQLKIEDLEGLEIPGYEVKISISSNLAIITVNGYQFNLDSDFNLSD